MHVCEGVRGRGGEGQRGRVCVVEVGDGRGGERGKERREGVVWVEDVAVAGGGKVREEVEEGVKEQ